MVVVTPDTPALFDAAKACRVRNLYTPYGLPASCADSPLDDPLTRPDVWHRCIPAPERDTEESMVVATGRLDLGLGAERYPGERVAQLRYFAVDKDRRGLGLGRDLLESFERDAARAGLTLIWMEARTEALGFYLRAGYRDIGLGPNKWGVIPHRIMDKPLTPERGGGAG